MADFSSIFAPNRCCAIANSGGTNILLCCERKQCGCGCGNLKTAWLNRGRIRLG